MPGRSSAIVAGTDAMDAGLTGGGQHVAAGAVNAARGRRRRHYYLCVCVAVAAARRQ